MRKLLFLTILVSVAISIICSCAEAVQYKLHVLNAPQGKAYSAAYKINDNGLIVGRAATNYDSRNSANAYYWDATGASHYAGFYMASSSLIGLNNSGTIVGNRYVNSSGSLTTLPTLQTNPNYASNILVDINNIGVVVGGSVYDTNWNTHATLWDSTGIHDLGVLDGDKSSIAYSVNDSGVAVGKSSIENGVNSRAVIWKNGEIFEIEMLPGYSSSIANGININEQVIGNCINSNYYYTGAYEKAFLWQNNQLIDLFNRNDISSYAADINNRGQIVGYTYSYYGLYKPYLWENGSITTLEGLGRDTVALGINNNGWIVGQAFGADRNWHAVVWEPVPEPSSLFALISGALALCCTKRKNKYK